MSQASLWGAFAPDDPSRRLPWVLPAAVLLVLLAFLGMGHVMQRPATPEAKPKPMETQIYELPDSPGSLPATSKGRKPSPQAARPSTKTGKPGTVQAQPTPHPTTPPSPATGKAGGGRHPPAKAERSPAGQPTTPPQTKAGQPQPADNGPAPAQPPPKLDWSTLRASVDSAVAQSAARADAAEPRTESEPADSQASLPNVHDPHTLVARYYIASLLRKLQRVGDMNYPTDQIGTPILRLVVGTQGELQHVSLVQSSGNDTLDRNAVQIAHQSAPFPPFPDSLKRKTSHIVLICHMSFEGYRQINPSF